MAALLGCIADDFTGATDLAGMLVKHGMRTVQMIGVPDEPPPDGVDAIVVALKSRTGPAADAVRDSLAALNWLQSAGCSQFYFKYCSTFDSTPAGNIGPVAEALMDALHTGFTIACPAFPANRRTIYKGYLFVGEVLLNESGMQHHPLTPMTDANLVRVLQQQSSRQVGLIRYSTVSRGCRAIMQAFTDLQRQNCGLAIVDALSDRDLIEIGAACADLPLVTAGSGLAIGIAENFRRSDLLPSTGSAASLPKTSGARAVIAGSCSTATREQVEIMRQQHPAFRIDPMRLAQGQDVVGEAISWAAPYLAAEPVLVYATAPPEEVKAAQAAIGAEKIGIMVERALAEIAQGLVTRGVGQMIIAGGETAGAAVKALGVTGLRIGPEIDPGVPWTVSLKPVALKPASSSGDRERPLLALALKSGNFGAPDFFLKAWSQLP
jgi:3-dehydrotetronate 4-kinase